MTNTKLDALTAANTAFSCWEELVTAGLRGYSPTFAKAGETAVLGANFDSRMAFEGASARTFWRD